ncbi:hypothetical protein LZQ00_18355 [Sphingobacterium sp. SRCM116780]|uniref:hypothetical protein n=1 Tax=Sphingobacterium sp. SRCM116780 TaxID=2907623 RepID=UPI001F2731B6|nr:hypothetical protein [Sphingobacterium sp. SRCM116780]UIR56211.1 hypothetical protein LZQ00_18355 [Sphingobacterium sp. SRCM116780]
MGEARMYIADQRNEVDFEDGLLRSTLNYEDYYSSHKEAIGKLLYVNEWHGIAKRKLTVSASADTIMIILPLLNAIEIQIGDQSYLVGLGELIVIPIRQSFPICIHQIGNFEEGFIFQQFVFQATSNDTDAVHKYSLPLGQFEQKNKMLPILMDNKFSFQLFIGAFYGKEETNMLLPENCNKLFAYPLNGSFEVEERLLFFGDGLFLSDLEVVEMECLSINGLILLIAF